jgi:tetratricopeptide (TPR) repeat protein
MVDVEKEMNFSQSNPGRFFWDHVHLTPEGNYSVAMKLAGAMELKLREMPLGPAQSMPGYNDISNDLLYTEWDRLNTAALMHQRVLRPPFVTMPDYRRLIGELTKQVSGMRDLITRTDVEKIRDRLHAASVERPDDFYVQTRLFRIYEELEEYPKAYEVAEHILNTWPHERTGHGLIARCMVREGRVDEALASYEQSEVPGAVRPKVVARIESASVLADMGRYDMAMKLLNQALDIDPAYAKVWYNRALVNVRIGESGLAESDFRKALEFEPGMAEAYNNLGVIALRQERFEDAEKYFREAVEHVATHIGALRNLAMVTMKKGDWETARACSEKLVYLDPDLSQVSALKQIPPEIKPPAPDQ